MSQEEEKIPFHTRFGLRLLQVLLIIFALFLVQRCVVLYQDNKVVNQQLTREYFDRGYESGMKKARHGIEIPDPQFKNYTLKKAYREGYRKGWDEGREETQ